MRRVSLAVCVFVALAVACDGVLKRPGYCDDDTMCSGATPRCNPSLHACEGIDDAGVDMAEVDLTPPCRAESAATDCTDPAAPICGGAGCRACAGSADDAACLARASATPVCKPSGTNAGRCVACVPSSAIGESSACGSATPVCDESGACRACAAHAECASGICIRDGAMAGRCAPTSEVALVDNRGTSVTTCKGAHSMRDGASTATAYCDVAEAVVANRSYVLVRGSSEPYGAITLADQSITIVGPGSTASPTARLFTVGAIAINVTVNTGTRQSTLDGVDLGGDAVTKSINGLKLVNNSGAPTNAVLFVRDAKIHDSAQEGLSASGGTVTVSGSTITGSGGAGLSASGGTVTLERSLVQDNKGGVVLSSAVNYTLENNFIVQNPSTATPGVSIDDTSSGIFRFNTVANNATSSGVGGIRCGSADPKPIVASIVVGNSSVMGTQVGAQCSLDKVVTGADNAPNAIMKMPMFKSASDFHLVVGDSANLGCCIDQLDTGPMFDFDDETRPQPQGGKYDIGADEVQ